MALHPANKVIEETVTSSKANSGGPQALPAVSCWHMAVYRTKQTRCMRETTAGREEKDSQIVPGK